MREEDRDQLAEPEGGLRLRLLPLLAMTGALAATGLLDHVTGARYSVLALYAAVVAAAGWWLGRLAAVLLAAVAIAVWFAVRHDVLDTTRNWNGGIFFLVLSGLGYLAALQRQLRGALAHSRWLARNDPLTGVFNVRAFYSAAQIEVNRARRGRRWVAAAFVDLDHFKALNDSAGHAAGDQALRSIVAQLRRNLRSTDVIGRLGGDEFALVLPDTDLPRALLVVDRIRVDIQVQMRAAGWPVTASIGVAAWKDDPPEIDDILRVVDGLMYDAKRLGRNTVRALDPGAPATAGRA